MHAYASATLKVHNQHILAWCFVQQVRQMSRPPQDLESRKRAPLYNKKQEEETQAALEAAAEAKAAAAEARSALKDAEVGLPSSAFQQRLCDAV